MATHGTSLRPYGPFAPTCLCISRLKHTNAPNCNAHLHAAIANAPDQCMVRAECCALAYACKNACRRASCGLSSPRSPVHPCTSRFVVHQSLQRPMQCPQSNACFFMMDAVRYVQCTLACLTCTRGLWSTVPNQPMRRCVRARCALYPRSKMREFARQPATSKRWHGV